MISDKTTRALDHANAVFARLDEREGAVRDAAERERNRLNASLGRSLSKVGIAAGLIGIPAIAIDLFWPIGLLGWLAAAGLGTGVAGLLVASGDGDIAAPKFAPDLPNGQMVQRFDSYLFRARRALPPPARAELDLLSAQLPSLRQMLERVPDLDPNAQDARRLLAVHLPNLIDHYVHVPPAYRRQPDNEGLTVDERLVKALAAGRGALIEIGERLARGDLAAFETQGRFIQSRYAADDERLQLPPADPGAGDPRVLR